jgi:hypothetical protein
MNLAQYLMRPVTPLYDVVIVGDDCAEYRTRLSQKRADDMVERYRKVMRHKVLSSVAIGDALNISKPLTGLRKLEERGYTRVHHVDTSNRGRKQLFWEWVE